MSNAGIRRHAPAGMNELDGMSAASKKTTRNSVSLMEICDRHESFLVTHFQTLNLVKDQTMHDPDAFRAVALMTERTQKLMGEFQILKERLVGLHAMPKFAEQSRRSTNGNAQTATTAADKPGSTAPAGAGKKRTREEDTIMPEFGNGSANRRPLAMDEPVHIQKRKREGLIIPGNDEDVSSARPVSMEAEDISEEVRHRLEIRRERRENRKTKANKRKRESFLSSGSASSWTEESSRKPKRKKMPKLHNASSVEYSSDERMEHREMAG